MVSLGVVVVVAAVGVGAVMWWNSQSSGAADADARPVPGSTTSVAAAVMRPTTTTTPSGTTTAAAPAHSDPTWYKLTAYKSVSGGNGFYWKDSVRIGTQTYPASIAGEYPSSTSDPSNRAVWAIGGNCTRFQAWVGKDIDSSESGTGSGGFYLQGDGRDLASVMVGPADPPQRMDVDITGYARLTLYDTRKSVDMNNAWGTPEVLCTSAPGQSR
ncbi:hypothetical protein C5F51_12985 [Nocardia nova]|uniref:Glycosyl hydrolase family 98 putative carbohydrate-binding module domain-containing protein n=1 Tax=Nocardia nova TaxID=37330 RepID=A0A2S6A8K3_9NOCA|nr:hypothetical protein C5F51_12985 [Nocardia nova]